MEQKYVMIYTKDNQYKIVENDYLKSRPKDVYSYDSFADYLNDLLGLKLKAKDINWWERE